MNNDNQSFVDLIPKPLLLLITVLFSILTAYSLMQFGLTGIFKEGFQNSATTQIFIDLIISTMFFLVWLKQDAKKMNRNFILWTIITLSVGSFGPLLYLLTRKSK